MVGREVGHTGQVIRTRGLLMRDRHKPFKQGPCPTYPYPGVSRSLAVVHLPCFLLSPVSSVIPSRNGEASVLYDSKSMWERGTSGFGLVQVIR